MTFQAARAGSLRTAISVLVVAALLAGCGRAELSPAAPTTEGGPAAPRVAPSTAASPTTTPAATEPPVVPTPAPAVGSTTSPPRPPATSVPTLAVASARSPTPTGSASVVVLSSSGCIRFTGLVRNVGNARATGVTVNVVGMNNDGTVAGVGQTLTVPSVIAAGETAAFDVTTSLDEVFCRRFRAELVKTSITWATDVRPTTAASVVLISGPTNQCIRFTGQVRNVGSATARNVTVNVVGMNDDGTVAGVGSALTVPSAVPAGGTAAFDVNTSLDSVFCRRFRSDLLNISITWD